MNDIFQTTRRHIVCAASLAAFGALPWAALAQSWPTARPISLVVGYPPGGSVDLVARIVAEPLAKRLGTPIIVENAGGAGGTIGGQRVVNSKPDGFTLLLGSGSEVSIARLFNTAIKYRGETDLTPIGMIGVTPMVFVAAPRVGVKTLDEALAKAKREPNQLSFASAGIGTPLHIPYRGATQMMQDVLGGNVEFGVFVLSSALPQIEAGKLVPLGVTTAARSRAAPSIPALAESPRLKGYDMNVWFGLFGPAHLPPAMVSRLNQELNAVLRDQAVWQKLQKAGISNDGGTPQQLTAFIKAETQRVNGVVTKAIASGPTW